MIQPNSVYVRWQRGQVIIEGWNLRIVFEDKTF